MVGDTGAEVHVVGEKDRCYMINIRAKDPPCVLDTANGTIHLSEQGEVVCDGILLKHCVYNPHVKFSLASISCLEEDGWVYMQGKGRCCIVRCSRGRDEGPIEVWRAVFVGGNVENFGCY